MEVDLFMALYILTYSCIVLYVDQAALRLYALSYKKT